MAKKTHKRAAAKAAKKSKALTRKKGAKKKSAATAKPRKAAAPHKSKPAKKKPVRHKIAEPPPKSFPEKVAGAFTAVVDILTDAERLHHKLDPGVSREPE